MRNIIPRIVFLLALTLAAGCASYTTPEHASSAGSSTHEIAANFSRASKPAFPARIAVVRADNEAWDPTAPGFDHSHVNRDAHYVEKYFAKTPQPLLEEFTFAPQGMKLGRAGYEACPGPTHAPTMYLAIKVTQESHNESFEVGPLGLLTLGLMPNHFVVNDTSACLALVDAKTGYIYALADASDRAIQIHSIWTTGGAERDAADRAQDHALAKLGKQFPALWLTVVEQYAARPAGE